MENGFLYAVCWVVETLLEYAATFFVLSIMVLCFWFWREIAKELSH